MHYVFDEDSAVVESTPGVYRGTLTDRWNVAAVPNGGYVLAVAMAALKQALPEPDPLTVTAHYLGPASPGEVEIAVDVIKRGRQFCTAMAGVRQNGRDVVRVLATYGDFSKIEGPTHIDAQPPVVPPLDQPPTAKRMPSFAEIRNRFEVSLADTTAETGSPRPRVKGWIRFADRRPMDTHCLGLIADAFPPAVFNVTEPGWVPTLELTLHVRARPQSDVLRCVFQTRFMFGGLLEEDGEIWDENGTLVAQSRQLAGAPRQR